ncbi:MAG: hypothetical protein ACK5LC_01445, partial [Coprobacillaceae bacterium]
DRYSDKLESHNHMFKYLLKDLVGEATKEKAPKTRKKTRKYWRYINWNNYNIDTGNLYFDLQMSKLLYDYVRSDITVKAIIKIEENEMSDMEVVDRIIQSIIETLELAKDNNIKIVTIEILNKIGFVSIKYKFPVFEIDESKIVDYHIKYTKENVLLVTNIH